MEWISVKDRLPPEAEDVQIWKKEYSPITAFLVYGPDGKPSHYCIEDWHETYIQLELNEVTHWRELPKPPQE